MPRGGKREGAGRPKGTIKEEPVKNRTVAMTDKEHKAFLAKGGAKWLRPLLRGEITD